MLAAKADEAQAPLKGRFNRSWHAVFTRAVTAAGGIGTCSLQGVHAALQELGVAATESQVRAARLGFGASLSRAWHLT